MNLTEISKHAESVEQFISDVARAFRAKRWVKILSLAGVVFALLLNPFSVDWVKFPRPSWYSYLVWGIVTGSFFVAAFLVALLIRPKEKAGPPPQTSIIKGLLAYTNTKEDAGWFARLQRGIVLHDCLRFCLDKGSSFAILTGESGTGKTSFLQAGLSPSLEAQGQRAVCVKLTDSPPLALISQSLNGHSNNTSTDQQTLVAVLRQAILNEARPIILILDQFEQFFTRNKSKAARRSFIEQMAEWHKVCDSLPVKVLISVRDDFADQLSDFQKQMDYTLTAHNKLRLEKFEPQEAAQVIGVIAREAQIELDEAFVKELTRHELADREEGTVSPVDIQILSWMLDGQKTSEERAFNRRAFQKLGGVEGLLERFLSRQLDARDTEPRRQTAIKVMLALTDQNVRAGALSLKALKEKLGGIVSDHEVEEAVSWLARSEVRLITQVQEKNVTLYELAHERIIAPLRRLAFKEISSAEKAQQTLDRRVNEWIGNNRARRYLLTFREWRLIRRHWPLIRLDSQKEQKDEFLTLSRRRFAFNGALLAAVIIFGSGAYGGYAWYEARPQSQLKKAHRNLISLLNQNKDTKAMEYASLLLSVLDAQQDQQMSQELWEQIKRRDTDRAIVLARLGQAYLRIFKVDEAVKVLTDAQHEGSTLESSDRSDLLRSEADSYTRVWTMSRTTDALKGLQGLRELAEKSDPIWRLGALGVVADAHAKLSQCSVASNMWDTALHGWEWDQKDGYFNRSRLKEWFDKYIELKKRCGESIAINGLKEFKVVMARLPPDDRKKLQEALRDAAKSISIKAKSIKQAKSATSPQDEVFALISSAMEIDPPNADETSRILEKASSLAESLTPDDRLEVLFLLGNSYVEVGRTDEATRSLQRIELIVEADPSFQKEVLWGLALQYCELSKVDHALTIMEKAEAVEKPDKFTLKAIVAALTKLSRTEAIKGLNKIRKVVETLPQSEQADFLLLLAGVYSKFEQISEAENTLVQAQTAANAKSSSEKSLALIEIAAAYAKLGKWAKAVETAQSIGNEVHAIAALVRILIISKEGKPGTYSDAFEDLFRRIEMRF